MWYTRPLWVQLAYVRQSAAVKGVSDTSKRPTSLGRTPNEPKYKLSTYGKRAQLRRKRYQYPEWRLMRPCDR